MCSSSRQIFFFFVASLLFSVVAFAMWTICYFRVSSLNLNKMRRDMLFAFCFCFCFHCFVYLLFSLISLVGYGGCCAHRTLTIFSMFIFVFIFFYFASPSCWISIVNDQRTFVIVSTLFFFSFAFLLLVRLNCFILPNGLSIPTAYTTKPK